MLAFIYIFILSIYVLSHAFTINPDLAERTDELSYTSDRSEPTLEENNDSQEINIRIFHNMNLSPLNNETKPFDYGFTHTSLLKNGAEEQSVQKDHGIDDKASDRLQRRRKYVMANPEPNNLISRSKTIPDELDSALRYFQNIPQTHEVDEKTMPNEIFKMDAGVQQLQSKMAETQNGYLSSKYPNRRFAIQNKTPNDESISDSKLHYQQPSSPIITNQISLGIHSSELKKTTGPLETFGNSIREKSKGINFLDSPDYGKSLLLRKTKKVELLIKNQNGISKLLKSAMNEDLYPAFKVLNEQPITSIYDSNFRTELLEQFEPKDSVTNSGDHINFPRLPAILNSHQQNKLESDSNSLENQSEKKISDVNKSPLFENSFPNINEKLSNNADNAMNSNHANGLNKEELQKPNSYPKNVKETKLPEITTDSFPNSHPSAGFKMPNDIVKNTVQIPRNNLPHLNPVDESEILYSPIPPESHLQYEKDGEPPYIQEQKSKSQTGMEDGISYEQRQSAQEPFPKFPTKNTSTQHFQTLRTPPESHLQYENDNESPYVQEPKTGMEDGISYESGQSTQGTSPNFPIENPRTQLLWSLQRPSESYLQYGKDSEPSNFQEQKSRSETGMKDGISFESNQSVQETFPNFLIENSSTRPLWSLQRPPESYLQYGKDIEPSYIQEQKSKSNTGMKHGESAYIEEQKSKPNIGIKYVPLYIQEQKSKSETEMKDGISYESNQSIQETFPNVPTENPNTQLLWSLPTSPESYQQYEKGSEPPYIQEQKSKSSTEMKHGEPLYIQEQESKYNTGMKDGISNEPNQSTQETFLHFPTENPSIQPLWTSQTHASEAITKRFGNLTDLEELPLKYKNVSQSFLFHDETEYVASTEQKLMPTTFPTTSTQLPLNETEEADYYAKHPPLEKPIPEEKEMDPKMLRMHIKSPKKPEERLKRYEPDANFSERIPKRKAIDSDSWIAKRAVGVHTRNRRRIDEGSTKKLRPIDQQLEARGVPYDGCCYNGGTCIVGGRPDATGSSTIICMCSPAYTGRYCETQVDECRKRNILCKEHEVCENINGVFACSCAPNFVREGDDCIPAMTCEEFPCLNGADCEDTENGGFKCRCPLGYRGKTCDIRVPQCEDSSCSKEQICVSTEIGYECMTKDEAGNNSETPSIFEI